MEWIIVILIFGGLGYFGYRMQDNENEEAKKRRLSQEKKPIIKQQLPPQNPFEGHTNIRRISNEKETPEPSKEWHEFPDMGNPITHYEDFSRTLFILKKPKEDILRKWHKTIGNDYPTILEGTEAWAITEMRKRLRPHRPVIFDPFGFWEETSKKLEMNPFYEDNITRAFLKFPEAGRPCIITLDPADKRTDKTHSKHDSFIVYRYGFEDFVFHKRYLQDAPEEILHYLMAYLMSKPEVWESLSPARLRQHVLKKIRDEEEKERAEMSVMEAYRQEREEEKYNNRFAALWELREEQQPEKKLETSDGDGK